MNGRPDDVPVDVPELEDVLPDDVVPDDVVPDDVVLEDVVPEDLAEDVAPEDVAPEDVAPEDVAPEDVAPEVPVDVPEDDVPVVPVDVPGDDVPVEPDEVPVLPDGAALAVPVCACRRCRGAGSTRDGADTGGGDEAGNPEPAAGTTDGTASNPAASISVTVSAVRAPRTRARGERSDEREGEDAGRVERRGPAECCGTSNLRG